MPFEACWVIDLLFPLAHLEEIISIQMTEYLSNCIFLENMAKVNQLILILPPRTN